ncbi:putative N6-adenine-specific DNA methylase/tRNA (guanine6-N2)-methyltransferase [Limimonas halophila]|uniref:Putative N6-adenine-specific DNA methylase/tRNA (Guanine6-N2)-methyltransferase n=1 Tax=Limimonas halophila TaxID=1082479 RepID=A0A1G7RFB6_9PROT|nr:THUMP domain-containing protein [Limimonas halophila]SDG09334.1 putative N6-adenine-specific DNA methylase/tRNA (guanine6-N2)-methyltransferase [Limimonas halophila]
MSLPSTAHVPQPVPLVLTTNAGLEDIVAAELSERVAEHGGPREAVTHLPERVRGRVRVDVAAPADTALAAAMALRSAHHVLRPLASLRLPDDGAPAAVAETARHVAMPELTPDTPFRVTTERSGEHPFTSVAVNQAVGAALQAATGAPVSLDAFAVEIRVDIVDRDARISVQHTRQPLSMRHPMRYRQRVALRATVAHATARLAGLGLDRPPLRIGDPFCGTGTLLIEAGAVFPEAALLGGDHARRAAAGARRNLAAMGLGERAAIKQLDARELADHWAPDSLDLVLTNPPYGRRIGRGIVFEPFYGDILAQLRRVLRPGGRAAVLTDRRGPFRRAVHRIGGFGIPHQRVLRTGSTFPAIVVLEKHA